MEQRFNSAIIGRFSFSQIYLLFEDKSTIYNSLVALVKVEYPFDDALQDRAVRFLKDLEPAWDEHDYAVKLATDLVPSSASPFSGFIEGILTLLSSPHSTIVEATFKFLRCTIGTVSPAIRDGLMESDLVAKVFATVQPHTLPLSGNPSIIIDCIYLAFPSSLMDVGNTSTNIDPSKNREMILHKVVLPSSQFVTFLITNRRLSRMTPTHFCGLSSDAGNVMIAVDFANAYLGGGALGFVCLLALSFHARSVFFSAELRARRDYVCPRSSFTALLSFPFQPANVLLCLAEKLNDREALLIEGAEFFSKYSGYAHTPPSDIPKSRIIVIDALCFSGMMLGNHLHNQWSQCSVDRELNKAFVGFSFVSSLPPSASSSEQPAKRPSLSTGHWGCGAFNGNRVLKILIEWLAASESGLDFIDQLPLFSQTRRRYRLCHHSIHPVHLPRCSALDHSHQPRPSRRLRAFSPSATVDPVYSSILSFVAPYMSEDAPFASVPNSDSLSTFILSTSQM
ncbi:putative Poly (ADP-ribose) glycohydrolase (PARG) [Blattamonas nauphoetae]|uniref:Poly (ADP-ribose) glycohydrolase (PARG) n=1 Tax=Blattamonas nauphoetae TaxID=2049346 RepID=A0ABQ9WZ12_9EUKA|nr:putative Poly (ADP-ribose) glycohydrolase (PARG) [Blattamonas nauphoetae]